MVSWLEGMLQSETLTLPEIVRAKGGLAGINDALEMLKDNSVSGKRVVVGPAYSHTTVEKRSRADRVGSLALDLFHAR
ncbi:hypothetical protein VTN02DRAFT_1253 [Thermoascus thermophilus]